MNTALESNVRLIVSGDTLELFNYKQPYFYNWLSTKRPTSWGEAQTKRKDNTQRAVATIRRLIQCNQEDQIEHPKFITLTHAQDIKEVVVSNPLFSDYAERVRRTFGDMQYLAVPEFMPVSGRVHYHALYFNLPFVSDFRAQMSRLWEHGSTKIEAVRSINAMPRYMGKYMTKSLSDSRTARRKSFFVSRNLRRPILLHEPKRIGTILQQWGSTLNEIGTKDFKDYRGRDITYHLFKGAKALTDNLRLLQSAMS